MDNLSQYFKDFQSPFFEIQNAQMAVVVYVVAALPGYLQRTHKAGGVVEKILENIKKVKPRLY